MASIVNGLFSARQGIGSHGAAIAVVGDNISNSSTIGFKSSRAEFQDIIAGGQTSGRVIGAGSSVSAVTSVFEQGTLEFTGRTLDLAVDGNGLFVVADGNQRYYTRAGNFSIDSEGFLVNPNGFRVLGFPSNGTGSLEPISINTTSQDSVSTTAATVAGNLDASSTPIVTTAIPDAPTPGPSGGTAGVTYAQLNSAAAFSTVVDVFDTLGAKHTVSVFFYNISDSGNPRTWRAQAYVNSEEVDTAPAAVGEPRSIGSVDIAFNSDGTMASATTSFSATVPWNNGSDTGQSFTMDFGNFTEYSSPSNILSITQDGKGIGTVGNVSVEKNGQVFALLDNGQAAVIGTIGLVNFANVEGLVRIGGTLLLQSPSSGEPVIGRPQSGTFGAVSSGSLELSTVDIASEFVKLITLQRGFQANSRIITTINQLLSEIIQLV